MQIDDHFDFLSGAYDLSLCAMGSPAQTIPRTGFIIAIGAVVVEISPAKGWRPFRHFGRKNEKKAPI